jgi:hypothetical protein
MAAALGLLTVLCAAALFVRFRQAEAAERDQIKWLPYACGLFGVVYLTGLLLEQATIVPALRGSRGGLRR